MKMSIAENFMRPAKAPVISAPVSTAKVIWKKTKRSVGMDPVMLLMSMPLKKA